MLKKIILLSITASISHGAHAGLFDSNDFKCGRADSITALSDYIKNDASGLLQSNFITSVKKSFSKPMDIYQNKLNTLGLVISDVSTLDSQGGGKQNCSATVSIKLPQETIDLISEVPQKLSLLTGSNGKLNNGSVTWSDIRYSIKLADNKKDILVSGLSGTNSSSSLYNVALMAVDKDNIINNNSQGKLNSVQYEYAESDRELNDVWKNLPDSARNAMKKEQIAWVNEKVTKCGKLSDTKLGSVSIQQKINILQCQTTLTNERISYLGGNNY